MYHKAARTSAELHERTSKAQEASYADCEPTSDALYAEALALARKMGVRPPLRTLTRSETKQWMSAVQRRAGRRSA